MIQLLWIARAMLLVSILAYPVLIAVAYFTNDMGLGLFFAGGYIGLLMALSALFCVLIQFAIYIRRRKSSTSD